MESFDDFNSPYGNNDYIPPFPFKDKIEGSQKTYSTLEWLNDEFDARARDAMSRIRAYYQYQEVYNGIHQKRLPSRRRVNDESPVSWDKATIQIASDLIDDKISMVMATASDPVFIPQNSEISDISNAKTCKMLVESRAEEIDLQSIFADGDICNYIGGTHFTFVLWDPSAGPEHPFATPEIKESAKLKGNINIGDVCVEVKGVDEVFPQRFKSKWSDVDDVFYYELKDKNEVIADYPKAKGHCDIAGNDLNFFSELGLNDNGKIMVKHYWHRKNPYLPNGKYIKFINGIILEESDHPYADGELPCVIGTDKKLKDSLFGYPTMYRLEKAQTHHNVLTRAVARNHSLMNAPKWMMPKGACSIEDLNNDAVIVEYKGAVAPQLVSANPTGVETFTFLEKLEGWMSRLGKVFDTSRGEPPKGVTANSALRFLDEQESRINYHYNFKRKQRIAKIFKMMLCRMGQFYDESDGRMARILGKDNGYLIKSFKRADFSKVADVRIKTSPKLPNSISGKIASIVDLNLATSTDPVYTRSEVIQALDLAMDDAFQDAASIAAVSAKSALDAILFGEESPPEPEPGDDLLTWYSVFTRALQESSYKTTRNTQVKNKIKEYVMAIEMFMWERANKNSAFAQKVALLDNFPIFYTVPQEDPRSKGMLNMPVSPQQSSQPAPPMGQNQLQLSQPQEGDIE